MTTPTTLTSPAPSSSDGQQPPPLQFGMLLYPGFTLLDFAGPEAALGMHGRKYLVAKTRDPVETDSGVTVLPTATFAECPRDLDVLFVPGGFGTAAAMADPETVQFVADRAQSARYVTSVCSGSLILAAAGALDGYRATTHWAALDDLAAMGVEVERGRRVVTDRNRVTGGGVTAGLDFGLVLLAALRGEEAAKLTQLMMEYDPAPPFDAGSPKAAGPALTAMAVGAVAAWNERMRPSAAAPDGAHDGAPGTGAEPAPAAAA